MDKHFKNLLLLEKVAEAVEPVRSSKHASMIMFKNDVISVGTNELKTHPFQSRFSKNDSAIFLHAETRAILKSLKKISIDDLKKSTLYVLRVKKYSSKKADFIWGNSKPCMGCQRALAEFGIKNVIYSTNIDNSYQKNYEYL